MLTQLAIIDGLVGDVALVVQVPVETSHVVVGELLLDGRQLAVSEDLH